MNYMFALLHDCDVKEYLTTLNALDRMTFAYHVVARIDRFVAAIAKAGADFAINAAIVAGTLGSIKLEAYQNAVDILSDDFKNIVKAANGRSKTNPLVSIRPLANLYR